MLDNNEFDNDYENDSDQTNNEPDRNSRQFVRKLEEEAKAGKQAAKERDAVKAEAEAARRELAFLKAGIDVDSPTGKLFAKAYDGSADLDSVKAAASEYGLIPTSQEPAIKDDLAALDRVSKASTGASAPIEPSVFDRIKEAGSKVDANGNLDPRGKDEILRIVQEAGIGISHEQPGEWVSLV